MRLFPAIDIQGGRCVRLRRGDFADETVFGDDPWRWLRTGWRKGRATCTSSTSTAPARGSPATSTWCERIAEAVPVPVQMGGGIRSEAALALDRREPRRAGHSGHERGGGQALSSKSRSTFSDPAGWWWRSTQRMATSRPGAGSSRAAVTATDLVRRLEEKGVREVLYTDISRDGMMQNVNLDAIRALADDSGLEIIASGGVTSLDDLRALKELEPLGVTGRHRRAGALRGAVHRGRGAGHPGRREAARAGRAALREGAD